MGLAYSWIAVFGRRLCADAASRPRINCSLSLMCWFTWKRKQRPRGSGTTPDSLITRDGAPQNAPTHVDKTLIQCLALAFMSGDRIRETDRKMIDLVSNMIKRLPRHYFGRKKSENRQGISGTSAPRGKWQWAWSDRTVEDNKGTSRSVDLTEAMRRRIWQKSWRDVGANELIGWNTWTSRWKEWNKLKQDIHKTRIAKIRNPPDTTEGRWAPASSSLEEQLTPREWIETNTAAPASPGEAHSPPLPPRIRTSFAMWKEAPIGRDDQRALQWNPSGELRSETISSLQW